MQRREVCDGTTVKVQIFKTHTFERTDVFDRVCGDRELIKSHAAQGFETGKTAAFGAEAVDGQAA